MFGIVGLVCLTGCATTQTADGQQTQISINPLASIQRAIQNLQPGGQPPNRYQPPASPQGAVARLRYDADMNRLVTLVKSLPVTAPDGRAIGFAVPDRAVTGKEDYPGLPPGIRDGINVPLPAADHNESTRLLARQIGAFIASMPTRPVVILTAPETIGSAMQREIEVYSRNTATVKMGVASDLKKPFLTIYLTPPQY